MAGKRKIDDMDSSDSERLRIVSLELQRELAELYFGDTEEQRFDSTNTQAGGASASKNYSCDQCGEVFTRKANLTRHVLGHSSTFKCSMCGKQFRRKDNLARHRRTLHRDERKQMWDCNHCDKSFSRYFELFNHINSTHPLIPNQTGGKTTDKPKTLRENGVNQTSRKTWSERALGDYVRDETIYPNEQEKYDLLSFFSGVRSQIDEFLRLRLNQHGIRWYLSTQVLLYRENSEGEEIATAEPHFRSNTYTTLNTETLDDSDLNSAFHKISQSLESYLRESSGWIIKKVKHLKIHTIVYSPIVGSSFMVLPQSLKASRSILNIRNKDQKCFVWSVLSSLYRVENEPERVSHYQPHENELNMHNIEYPVSISKVEKFESQNTNISVNVFAYEDNEIVPLKITKHNGRLHHANLLLLKNQRGSHYCLITDLNRFLSRTKSHNEKHFFCPYCLHGFTREELLQNHMPYCSAQGAQKIILPEVGDNFLEFKEYEKSLKVPYVIFSDFETLNKPLDTCTPNPLQSNTHQTKLLTPCGFAYKVVCIDPRFTKQTIVYRGADASEKLIKCLLKEKEEIENRLKETEPMRLTKEDELNFKTTSKCCLCHKAFSAREQRARHHNHVTGAYIGATHTNCNLQCNQADFIPVIFHGLRNFDAHILCQSVGKFKQDQIKCIPNNMERYVSFSLGSLRFIDSYQFLPSSLETLVESLACDGVDVFPHLRKEFPENFQMLIRKGVYPYDYMNDEAKFEETTLPPIESFYSDLKRESISDKDYQHAQNVFRGFKLRNLGEYHDLYLQTDVVLLCDVFEQFRSVCLKQYELDPCHFYTSPGLSWSALLKKTGVCLELLTDIDEILFIEQGIRGGVSQISNRYKRANNPFVPNYEPNKPTSYIQYLDANNLYGWAMSRYLPYAGFKFLTKDEINALNVQSIPSDGPIGYIFEVSLGYPEELHDDHNDYPLAPEHRVIDDSQLSPYAERVLKKLHNKGESEKIPPRGKIEKLLTTLHDKEKYVLHYRNLQLYLQLGLEIIDIHRVMEFRQSPWMKEYIEFNTDMRKRAKSAFERNFYKLLNNSVFGKTMENLRKHKNVELCQRPRRLKKIAAKSTYKTHKIFTEDLVAVEFCRAKVVLNKPLYVGMSILDLSKYLMYDFYYNHLKRLYGNKIQLQMTDTDSLLFWCETDNVFHDMKSHLHLYDTSEFPVTHELYSSDNHKALGKFKSETREKLVSEFVGLRSKLYSLRYDNKEDKKAKGISRVAVRKDLKFDTYKQTLDEEAQVQSSMSLIRSHCHQLFFETVNKTSLSAFDDKRYLLDDGVSSLAYGHYKIKQ